MYARFLVHAYVYVCVCVCMYVCIYAVTVVQPL